VTSETVERLLPIQRAILTNGSKAVVAGGLLMYSTCTINPEENEEQVRAFLDSNEGEAFELIHLDIDRIGAYSDNCPTSEQKTPEAHSRRDYPGRFYYCRICVIQMVSLLRL